MNTNFSFPAHRVSSSTERDAELLQSTRVTIPTFLLAHEVTYTLIDVLEVFVLYSKRGLDGPVYL